MKLTSRKVHEIEDHVRGAVMSITCHTGEVYGLDKDLHTDLGLDSLDRVEVVTILEEIYHDPSDDAKPVRSSDLERIRTPRQIVDFIIEQLNG